MKPLPSTAPKIAEVLEELDILMWNLEADGKAEHIRYTDADVMHSLKVFMHVASNVCIHKMIEDGDGLDVSSERMVDFGKRLAQITDEMTGVDPTKYYKS